MKYHQLTSTEKISAFGPQEAGVVSSGDRSGAGAPPQYDYTRDRPQLAKGRRLPPEHLNCSRSYH
jgi:hypothetical protein